MPVQQEKRLKESAEKKGLRGEARDKFVFGTLRKMGWKPARERKGDVK